MTPTFYRYEDDTERIKVGNWSETEMHTGYEVVNFPIQLDQAFLPWYQPIDPSGAISEGTIQDSMDSGRGAFGGYQFSWIFGQLTPLMVSYLRQSIFNGNLFSRDVTVVTFDRSYGWRTINCKALWNDPATKADPVGLQGYQKLKIDFINGADAPADIDSAYSLAFSLAFNA